VNFSFHRAMLKNFKALRNTISPQLSNNIARCFGGGGGGHVWKQKGKGFVR